MITLPGRYDISADELAVSLPLPGGQFVVLDISDYAAVAGLRWRPLKLRRTTYAYRRVRGGVEYMHRVIAGTPKGYETDHINGDGLDNRKVNLRVATPSENRANTGKPRLSNGRSPSSIYKGVHRTERGNWMAHIQVDGRTRNLGRYATEVDAARAYDLAAIDAWGEFARVNFPGVDNADH